MLDADGDESLRTLLETEFRKSNPMVSPDGRWLAYISNRSDNPEIYVRPYPDLGIAVQAPAADTAPDYKGVSKRSELMWSSDSSELFFIAGDILYSITVSGENDVVKISRPVELFTLDPDYSSDFSAMGSGDDVRFVMVEVSPADEVDHLEVVQGFAAQLKRRAAEDQR
jgi:hypothetical protein